MRFTFSRHFNYEEAGPLSSLLQHERSTNEKICDNWCLLTVEFATVPSTAMASVTDSGSEKMAEEERNANADKLKEKANNYFKGNAK